MLKTEPFKRFCPEVNDDCIGKRCASFYASRREQDEMDKRIETLITTKKLKKEFMKEYKVVEKHMCGIIHTLYYSCSKFPHLNKKLTETEKCDLWKTTHGPNDFLSLVACNPISYTEDFVSEEKEVFLQ